MKRIVKKAFSCLLALTMTVSMIPSQTFAVDADSDEGGESSDVSETFNVEFETENELRKTVDLKSVSTDNVIGDNSETNLISLQAANFEFSTLSGKIVDSNGHGIIGVSVQNYNIDENTVLTLCTTNSNGLWNSVAYDVISGYTYVVRYYKTGYTFNKNNIQCVASAEGTTVEDVVATALNTSGLVCNENDYTYSVSDEKATITKYTGTSSAIILPSEYEGYPVVAIDAGSFENNSSLVVHRVTFLRRGHKRKAALGR